MYFIYSLLLTIAFIIMMPRFVLDALRHGKYIAGIRERLGNLPATPRDGQPLIWMHCVSVGEAEAGRPLIHALTNRFPAHRIVVSTTTLTGQAFARSAFQHQAAAVFYFPFDWAWTVRRALRALNPSAVLIMETEIWPRLLRECQRHEIPVALVNGRISEKSFRGYRRLGAFIRRAVNDLALALMQADADAERLRQLGFEKEIRVTGNLKFDSAEVGTDQTLTEEFRKRFGLNGSARLIVAASTHEPEERVILEAFKIASAAQRGRVRLLIAPRHPERFSDVAELLRESGLAWVQRSDSSRQEDQNCQVILLDTIGELRSVYPLADIVFVGGSIATKGGHNVIEPAAAGACVIVGPHTKNFAAITKSFIESDGLIQLPNGTTEETSKILASVFNELLLDEEKRKQIAERGVSVCRQNRGATDRTVEMLAGILSREPNPERLHVSIQPAVAAK